ncbi:MAG: winged helix-turn-helix domain-containing protein, partial [Vicinamibacteria bacterium]
MLLPELAIPRDRGIDLRSRSVRRTGEPVELSPKEFDLLMRLFRAEGAVLSRVDLLRSVWGYS